MNLEIIRQFALKQAARLQSGDIDEFVRHFDLPLPVFSATGVTVVTERDQLRPAVQKYHAILQALDVHTISPWAICIEDQSAHRAKITIRWDHLSRQGDCKAVSLARYVVRDPVPATQTEPSIEMVEYLNFAFPEIFDTLLNATNRPPPMQA